MKKNIKLIALVTLLATGYFFIKEKNNPISVSAAAGSRPTNIITTDMSDANVSNFYTGVEGLQGNALLAFLHGKIKDHLEYNYESTNDREIYKIIERDWELEKNDTISPADLENFDYSGDNGYMRLLYGDYNGDSQTAVRFYKEDAPTHVTFDKEHIWPQSLGDFGRTGGAGSDFHSLWAADPKINQNAHNNNHYAVPLLNITERQTSYGSIGGRTGKLTANGQTVFEPKDEYKGDIARAMFYMPARYFVFEDKLHPKLELVNGLPNPVAGTASITGKAGDLETLLEWNELDPVDEFEIHRNNLIYNNYQLNRNPFIDYPQWARIAYDSDYSGSGASNAAQTSSVGTANDPFKDAKLLSISLDTSNVKTEYLKGERFKTQGLEVTAHYDNFESRKTKNFTLDLASNTVLSTPGSRQVVVSFTHGETTKTESFTINVAPESLSDFLFISEVYGGGGNAGATYSHDYIEIYNHSDSPVSLAGKSIQQTNDTGTSWFNHPLRGEIAAKSFHLLKMGKANTTAGVFETPQGDVVGTNNFAVGAFKIALVNSASALTGDVVKNNPDVIDLVGAGTNVTDYYVSKAPGPSATQSLNRIFSAGVPSNNRNNLSDYELGNPSPTNSAISVAINIMAIGNTTDQCYAQYPIFKEKVLELTESTYDQDTNVLISHGQRYYFETGTDSRLAVGRTRYLAWANHLGDAQPYLASEENIGSAHNVINSNMNLTIFAIISFILLNFSVIYFLRGKKKISK